MTSDKDFISELQKLKSYKEVSALQTIKAFDKNNTHLYLLITTGGIVLCHQKFEQNDVALSNVLIVHDVVFKTNFSQVIILSELFIFVDEIVAFHSVDEQEYQRLSDLLQQE